MKLAVPFIVVANTAWAACDAGEQTFMSCRIEDSANVLRVCFDTNDVHYRFGPAKQAPDLALSQSITDVAYVPWPGVGQAIWEEVAFRNGAYRYTVWAGFDRMFDEAEYNATPHHGFGGVRVTTVADNVEVVTLECERATVEFAWDDILYRAKNARGLVWDDRTRTWGPLAQ